MAPVISLDQSLRDLDGDGDGSLEGKTSRSSPGASDRPGRSRSPNDSGDEPQRKAARCDYSDDRGSSRCSPNEDANHKSRGHPKPPVRQFIRESPRHGRDRMQTPYIPSARTDSDEWVRKKRDAAGEFAAPHPIKKKLEEKNRSFDQPCSGPSRQRYPTGSTRVPDTGSTSGHTSATPAPLGSPTGTPSYKVRTLPDDTLLNDFIYYLIISQYNIWEDRRSSSGGTPLLFRGNRPPTPYRKGEPEPSFENLTDSLLKFGDVEESKWNDKMIDELDFEELRNVDRQWYDYFFFVFVILLSYDAGTIQKRVVTFSMKESLKKIQV